MYKKYTILDGLEFEYDPNKNRSNWRKRGIGFEESIQLWLDPDCLCFEAKTQDEPRSLLISRLRGKHWTAVFTPRHHRIRIISVRRSRKSEIDLYESERI